MYLKDLKRLVIKAFRYSFVRPIQRFNVINRSKKYLGPEAKYFMPAPRAIGSLSENKGPIQYPHIQSSYRSVRQKRLGTAEPLPIAEVIDPVKLKSFSVNRSDDDLVVDTSHQLEVKKTVTVVKSDNEAELSQSKTDLDQPSRPLPQLTSLQLQDPRVIWQTDKVPQGRLNLTMLQEIMLNKLADEQHWTPKMIANHYNIKEEYAESLIKYYKQIRIVISPRMSKLLEYTNRNDDVYQSTKNLVYVVDKRLRNDVDKIYDRMFLPNEELDPEIKEMLDDPRGNLPQLESKDREIKRFAKRPKPLKIGPVNQGSSIQESSQPEVVKVQQLPAPNKEDSASER